ncbi:MAG: Histidinol-phosphate aminotransferase [Candidatus Udaeobacter sp.]|nr:MAG: Histidinol-phosphate aminotransferase [Candidatus Udaeobacter sp.]
MTKTRKPSRTAKANGQAHRGSRPLSDNARLKEFDKLGPFEIKDFVQKVASKTALENSLSYLNAGRGNPNWVATEPREAFFLLGQFAVTESKRVLDLPPGVGGMPSAAGIAGRLEAWLAKHEDMPGAPFLQAMVPWAVNKFSFDPDKFVHELVDSIIGDHYPVPDRMLVHNEQIVHEYLEWAMCGNPRPEGKFKIYAVEGGTAAMCYIFKSLKSNRILNPGDTIALGVPIFTPYLEMAHLEDYDLHYVEIHAKQEDRFQYPDEEIKKLLDPKIKAFFIVNPGNPFAVALSPDTIKKIGDVLKKRPDLILLTDDVYGTFVPGFRSLMGEFPENTIGVYSYSKYFGCTGWRLGTIAVYENNIFDKMIAAHPEPIKKLLDKRYGGLTLEPRKFAFIDRIVATAATSRSITGRAVASAAGHDDAVLAQRADGRKKAYQKACIGICKKRVDATIEGLDIEVGRTYSTILLRFRVLPVNTGRGHVKWMKATCTRSTLFRLARTTASSCSTAAALPPIVVRISFANGESSTTTSSGVRAMRADTTGMTATGKSARARRERNVARYFAMCCPNRKRNVGASGGSNQKHNESIQACALPDRGIV